MNPMLRLANRKRLQWLEVHKDGMVTETSETTDPENSSGLFCSLIDQRNEPTSTNATTSAIIGIFKNLSAIKPNNTGTKSIGNR